MQGLSDYLLKETYTKAVELELDKDFILMLEEELSKRTTDHHVQ
ncbi:MAG TPA: sporulation histidine kinase inhibitor Sda [Pseudogracilibacillus sp.]|nr:sporulation histidine kinase inhibitor Sda [Pseudogracilibacillus sp.]